MALKKTETAKKTDESISYMDDLIVKIISSLDNESINFINKNPKLLKKNYPTEGYCKNTRISLDGLISSKDHKLLPQRLIFFKEGKTHMNLLLSMSSANKINCFYKKLQNENILDPDDPFHLEVLEIINQHLLDRHRKKTNPSPKISLEFLKWSTKVTEQNLKKLLPVLSSAKKEYSRSVKKTNTLAAQYGEKSKEKKAIEKEVHKVRDEYGRILTLKRSLPGRKKKLQSLKKMITLHAKKITLMKESKGNDFIAQEEIPLKQLKDEKIKYLSMLEQFKDQKFGLKKIWMEIQKFSLEKGEILNKHANISDALSQLEQSLESDIAYKDSLVKEIKSLSLLAKYFDLEEERKAKEDGGKGSLSVLSLEEEKTNYKNLLVYFHDDRANLKEICREIKRFSLKKEGVLKDYSVVSDEALQLDQNIKRDNAYKNSLFKEIKPLTINIKNHRSDLTQLKKINDCYQSVESCITLESDHMERSIELQNKIFGRYKQNEISIHDDLVFNMEKYVQNFSVISLETERLCRELDDNDTAMQKTLKNAERLFYKMLKGKVKFEKISDDFSKNGALPRAQKLVKKLSKNKFLLNKVKSGLDGLESDLEKAKTEKETIMFALKEKGEKHDSLTGKWQIFNELSRERALANENIVIDIYKELVRLKVELATAHEIFNMSCVHKDEFLKTTYAVHNNIEGLRKNILNKIQGARESLQNEESGLTKYLNEQKKIINKYEEYCKKGQEVIDRGDIEVLIYQNSELMNKIDALASDAVEENGRYNFALKGLDLAKKIRNSLIGRADDLISSVRETFSMPRLRSFRSFPMLPSGAAVFLLLTAFSYLLVQNTANIYEYNKEILTYNTPPDSSDELKISGDLKEMSNISGYNKKIELFEESKQENSPSVEKINILKSNSLNVVPSSMIPYSEQTNKASGFKESTTVNSLWRNYVDIFDNLRFDNPLNAFRLFDLMMNKQTLDLTLMDSIQLLYSIRKTLESEEGPFFDRLFNDFVTLGVKKREAASNILYNNRIIEKAYNNGVSLIFKGRMKPIPELEKMNLKEFEIAVIPYIMTNYKNFAKFRGLSVPENLNFYATNLAQDIYISAKKFNVPITSMLTIAHQESFFINLLGDKGKSASPFQIYQPTKYQIFRNMRKEGMRIPTKVAELENHVTYAAFMAAYHFAQLIRKYSRSVIDPISHNPTALIVNLRKSTRFYNGGKHYGKHVHLKQRKLEYYLKTRIRTAPVAS